MSTWPTLDQHSYSAQLGQSRPSTEYCLKSAECHYWPLWYKLGKVRVLVKLGQSEPSTQYCLKWAEYHYWPRLAKLSQVRLLAELGQSGPTTERTGFKYQAQHTFSFFFSSFRFRDRRKMDFLIPKTLFFFFMAVQGSYENRKKCFSCLFRTDYLKILKSKS